MTAADYGLSSKPEDSRPGVQERPGNLSRTVELSVRTDSPVLSDRYNQDPDAGRILLWKDTQDGKQIFLGAGRIISHTENREFRSLVDDLSELPLVRKLMGDVVCTSAVTGAGLDELRQRVMCRFEDRQGEFLVHTGAGDGRLIAFLHENARVLDQTYVDANVEMRVRMDPALAGVIRNMGGRVEEVAAAPASDAQ